MNQNYLMVNETTNIVENVCLWNGNPNTWQPPKNYLMLVQETTPAFVWIWNQNDWVLTEGVSVGCIGFTWNGTACVTNEPKPEPIVQPVSSGTQDI